jgi:hypothetical protein
MSSTNTVQHFLSSTVPSLIPSPVPSLEPSLISSNNTVRHFLSSLFGEVPLEPVFFECVAEVHDSPEFLKILRIEFSHHHDNGNVLNRTSMDIGPFITNLLDEI